MREVKLDNSTRIKVVDSFSGRNCIVVFEVEDGIIFYDIREIGIAIYLEDNISPYANDFWSMICDQEGTKRVGERKDYYFSNDEIISLVTKNFPKKSKKIKELINKLDKEVNGLIK